MTKTDKEFLILVRADIAKALGDLKLVSNEITRTGASSSGAARQVTALSASTSGLESSLSTLSSTLGGVTAAYAAWNIGSTIKESALLTARVETLGVVLDVVGRNTGHTRGEMAGYVADVKEMGITSQVAAQAIIRMAQANLDLSQAARIARVAQDAAVVGNTNSSHALEQLIHGVVTLQPELLRTIGIVVSFEQEYRAAAEQMDRTAESLTSQEKQQIAMNAALREGEKLTGAYSAAMDTVGKKIGSLDRITEAAQEELGRFFQAPLAGGVSLWTTILESATRNLRDFNLALGTTGLERQPIETLDREIQKLTKNIAKLRDEQRKAGAMPAYGDNVFIRQLQFQLDKVREIRAEIAKTQGPAAPAAAAPAFTGPPKPSPELEKLRDTAKKLNAELREQAATLGLGAEEMMRYRLTAGDLVGTEKGLADQLLASSRAIDKKREAQARAQQSETERGRLKDVAARNAEADRALTEAMQEQIMLYGLSEREQAGYQAASKLSAGATDAQRAAAAALGGALHDLSARRERDIQLQRDQAENQGLLDAMAAELALAGATPRERAVATAEQRLNPAASEAERAAARALAGAYADVNAELERKTELQRNAESDQKYIDTLAQEVSLLQASTREKEQSAAVSRLSADATDAQRAAVEALSGALSDGKKEMSEMSEFAVQAARNIESTFADVLFDVMQGKLDNLGDRFKMTLDRMAADLAAAKFAQILLGDFGTTGDIGGFIGKLIGAGSGGAPVAAAEGGLISGPGTGTSDSIAARLSHGEYVVKASAVQRYGVRFMEAINRMQYPSVPGVVPMARPRTSFAEGGLVSAGGGRGERAMPNIIMHITTPDAASFRRSEMQVGQRAGEAVRRAMQRNG